MHTPLPALLSDGIVIEQAFPLRWRSLEAALSSSERGGLSSHNRQVLNVLTSMDGVGVESEGEVDTLSRELRCLDDKLNFVVSMLGTLLARDGELPAAVPTWLGARGLMCAVLDEMETPLPPKGDIFLLELFLEPRFPQPIKLPVGLEPVGQTSSGLLILAVFRDLGTEVTELLEKCIFRQHRRAIALSHKSQKSQ
jgi:hypothetical protein